MEYEHNGGQTAVITLPFFDSELLHRLPDIASCICRLYNKEMLNSQPTIRDFQSLIRNSIVASIGPCHGLDRGSIPRCGNFFFFLQHCFTGPYTWQHLNNPPPSIVES